MKLTRRFLCFLAAGFVVALGMPIDEAEAKRFGLSSQIEFCEEIATDPPLPGDVRAKILREASAIDLANSDVARSMASRSSVSWELRDIIPEHSATVDYTTQIEEFPYREEGNFRLVCSITMKIDGSDTEDEIFSELEQEIAAFKNRKIGTGRFEHHAHGLYLVEGMFEVVRTVDPNARGCLVTLGIRTFPSEAKVTFMAGETVYRDECGGPSILMKLEGSE